MAYKCPKCGRFYSEEILCPYCRDCFCRDIKSQSIIEKQAKRIEELEAGLISIRKSTEIMEARRFAEQALSKPHI